MADDAEHVDRFNPAEEFGPVVQQTDADRRRAGDAHHPRAAQLERQRPSRSWTRHFQSKKNDDTYDDTYILSSFLASSSQKRGPQKKTRDGGKR